MKVGQLLATGNDEDPLQELVDGIEPLPLERAQLALAASLSPVLLEELKDLQPAFHAASIGQVHRAWRKSDDKPLAVKIQYPDIAQAVRSEMRMLGWVPKMGPVSNYSFDLNDYKRVLSENFERELDYLGEAQRQTKFRENVRVDGLVVPKVISELCTNRVLVQDYVPGLKTTEAGKLPKSTRLKIARTLLQTLFHGVFKSGLVHGDPHPGNYRYTQSGEVIVYDFGCVVEIPEQKRLALLSLILRLRENAPYDPLSAFVALGFDEEKLTSLAEQLPSLAQILFAPFIRDEPFDPRAWRLKQQFDELLEEKKWWFRSAGPAQLFLLMRAFQGVIEHLEVLDVRLPWWALLQHVLSEGELNRARNYEAPRLKGYNLRCTEGLRALRVHLDRPKGAIDLSFPPQTARHLSEMVPEDSLDEGDLHRLREAEQNLSRGTLRAGLLLEGKSSKGSYRIWLE